MKVAMVGDLPEELGGLEGLPGVVLIGTEEEVRAAGRLFASDAEVTVVERALLDRSAASMRRMLESSERTIAAMERALARSKEG